MLKNPKWTPSETEIELQDWQKIIADAIALLNEKEWVQDSLYEGSSLNPHAVCMVGALQYAAFGKVYDSDSTMLWSADNDRYYDSENESYQFANIRKHKNMAAFKKAITKVATAVRKPVCQIPNYNDSFLVTKQRVINKLTKVMKHAR